MMNCYSVKSNLNLSWTVEGGNGVSGMHVQASCMFYEDVILIQKILAALSWCCLSLPWGSSGKENKQGLSLIIVFFLIVLLGDEFIIQVPQKFPKQIWGEEQESIFNFPALKNKRLCCQNILIQATEPIQSGYL